MTSFKNQVNLYAHLAIHTISVQVMQQDFQFRNVSMKFKTVVFTYFPILLTVLSVPLVVQKETSHCQSNGMHFQGVFKVSLIVVNILMHGDILLAFSVLQQD